MEIPPKTPLPIEQSFKDEKNIVPSVGKDLPEPIRLVYNTILGNPGTLPAEWMEQLGMATPHVLRALTRLELNGLVQKDPTGRYTAVNSTKE